MEARCQCGAVSFLTPLPQPLALYICHCYECRLQTGSAFGASAIFPRFDLPPNDLLSCYRYDEALSHPFFFEEKKDVVSEYEGPGAGHALSC